MKALKLALLTTALALPLTSISPGRALTISNLVTESSSIVISNLVPISTGVQAGRASTPLDLALVESLVGGGSVVISNLFTATVMDSEVSFSGELADAFSGRVTSTASQFELLLDRGSRAGVPPELLIADSIFLGLGGPPTDDLYPWFLVDISGWNGLEEIRIQNFWPEVAGILRAAPSTLAAAPSTSPLTVSIFTATSVPDGGGTLGLAVAGLLALAGLKRAGRWGQSPR